MSDRTDLFIRLARSIETAQMADDYAHSADEGTGVTPRDAAGVAWDASASLRNLGERLSVLADGYALAAKRYERAQREEDATGTEYRGGSAA